MKEYLNDTEKRLLFCAIDRELKICKKIDDDNKQDEQLELSTFCKSLLEKFMYDKIFIEVREDAIKEFSHFLIDNKVDDYSGIVDLTASFLRGDKK